MNNNKVILGDQTIMDISDSTVTPNNLLNGEIGYSGNGDRVVGSYAPPTAGHTIQNDSGTDMQRRDKLQFKGTYVEDDQTNNKTVVNVTRQMTLAEFNQLTAEQKKGLIDVTDQQGHPITASDIPYDSNNTVKEKIDEVDTNKIAWQSIKNVYITVTTAADGAFYITDGQGNELDSTQTVILSITHGSTVFLVRHRDQNNRWVGFAYNTFLDAKASETLYGVRVVYLVTS